MATGGKRIYPRGRRIYGRLKDASGEWISEPTPFDVGQEDAAAKYVAKLQAGFDKQRGELAGDRPPLTVLAYATAWLDARERRGMRTIDDDRARVTLHVLPHLGTKLVADVKPIDIRTMVRALVAGGALAARTVRNIYGITNTMFRDARVEELIAVNPCVLERGELPKKADKDPEWRALATYTPFEVQLLITDAKVAVERRVQYALKAIAGLRHGEVAGLRWRHYDAELEPLGRLVIATSYDTGRTKTEVTRRVPVHPTLATILAAWRPHWVRIHGREPTEDDLIVPTRTMKNVSANAAHKVMKADIIKLGLREDAGTRKRGGHDLRAWFISTAQEHGAHRDILRVITHTAPSDVIDGYTRLSWAALCAEVAKLRITVLDGRVLELATGFATAESTAANRWRKMATPTGFERVSGPASDRSNDVTERDRSSDAASSDHERMVRVASLATALASAVLAGDGERARGLAEQIQLLAVPVLARRVG